MRQAVSGIFLLALLIAALSTCIAIAKAETWQPVHIATRFPQNPYLDPWTLTIPLDEGAYWYTDPELFTNPWPGTTKPVSTVYIQYAVDGWDTPWGLVGSHYFILNKDNLMSGLTPVSIKTGTFNYIIDFKDSNGNSLAQWIPKIVIATTPAVGGVVVSVDKFGLLAPYFGLATTILAATATATVYVKRAKHKEEKQ